MTSPNLGRFVLVERIAQGGMGEVYRGVDAGLAGVQRPVAIKLIRPELADSERHVQDFINEAKVSFLISHPNVVQLLDAGHADDLYFMAMEWIDGTDLSGIRQQLARLGQRMPLALSIHIAIEAARGLDYAHRLCDAQGRALHLVHRDVSPSNILVSFEGAVKISDFGIAKSRLRQGSTQVGRVKGKLAYMAPEQARGLPVDHRADVFSLGIVLYELVTGRNPFTDAASDAEVLMRVQQCVYRPAGAVMPGLAPELEGILAKALVLDLSARYDTASALLDDLERFGRAQGLSASTSELSRFVREVMRQRPSNHPLSAEPTRKDRVGADNLGPTPTWSGQLSPPPLGTGSRATETDPGMRTSYRVRWIAAAAMLLAVAGAGWWRARPPPVPSGPQLVAAPEPAASQPPPTAQVPPIDPVPPTRSRPVRPPAKSPARSTQLTVTSDVSANVFVDGQPVGESPVDAFTILPGRHVVRGVDLNRGGMRHLPVEREIELRPGEQRQLHLAFQ